MARACNPDLELQRLLATLNVEPTAVSPAVRRVLNHIVQHAAPPPSSRPLHVSRLASGLGWTPRALNRRVRRETGSNLRAIVLAARMHEAAELLRLGEKVEVAAIVAGYSSRTAFIRAFRRQWGTSPLAYRLRHQSITDP